MAKTVAVQFDFLGKSLFDDLPLFVVKDQLIRRTIGSIFRFGSNAEGAVEVQVHLREYLSEIVHQILVTQNSIDNDFFTHGVGITKGVKRKPASGEILIERK